MNRPTDHSGPDDQTHILGQDAYNMGQDFPPEIGPYKLLRPLGAGGMGQVFLAEQSEPVQREVALKLILGHAGKQAAGALFEVERQMLARLQHPAIAQIYAAGSDDGLPWFAMELVEGEPLTEHCHRHRLTPDERIRLFIRICQGVQHAHQRGILHRDLKPANILVSRIDGRSVPRIIDFGVATSLGAADQAGSDRAGTPAYMSPEQFSNDKHSASVGDDIYALGVILFELLVEQRPPLAANELQIGQLCVALQRRHSTILSGPVAVQDQDPDTIELVRQARKLSFELRCILAAALAVDPDHRYQSVDALSDDLQYFLQRRPVSAVPDSRRYRLGRFCHRHAMALSSGAIVVVALIVALIASTLNLREAQRQFALAEERRHDLERVVGFQQGMLGQLDPRIIGERLVGRIEPDTATEKVRTVLFDQVMRPTEQRISEELADSPLTRARLERTLNRIYSNWGDYQRSLQMAESAVATFVDLLGVEHSETIGAIIGLAEISWYAGQLDRSLTLYQQVLDIRLKTLGDSHSDTLTAKNNLGLGLLNTGRYQDSLPLLEEVFAARFEEFGIDNDITLVAANNLAIALSRLGHYERALQINEIAVESSIRVRGENNPATLNARNTLAVGHMRVGNLERSRELHELNYNARRRIHGQDHPETLWTMNNLAATLRRLGDYDQARALEEHTLSANRRQFGEDHPDTLWSMHNLSETLYAQGDPNAALPLIEVAVAGRRRILGETHPLTLRSEFVLALVLRSVGRLDQAATALNQTLIRQSDIRGEKHADTLESALLQVDILGELGRQNQAGEVYTHHLQWLVESRIDRLDPALRSLHQQAAELKTNRLGSE
jgi:eukaryotic-like serine/threonine-protein kinase